MVTRAADDSISLLVGVYFQCLMLIMIIIPRIKFLEYVHYSAVNAVCYYFLLINDIYLGNAAVQK